MASVIKDEIFKIEKDKVYGIGTLASTLAQVFVAEHECEYHKDKSKCEDFANMHSLIPIYEKALRKVI
jgi:hypothetical protein